jgi:DNA-binding MarR family transcriptional regulator
VPLTLQDELGKKTPFKIPEQEAYLNLLRTTSLLGAPVGRLFKSHGLSEATYNALRILRGCGGNGCTCGQIGEHLVAQVPDVTRLIDRLEKAGFAERARNTDDRRIVRVKITRRGLDLLARLDGPILSAHRQQLGHMTRRELAELSRLLVKARHPEEPLAKE